MKTDLFQSCGQCWVFQICWHIECSTLTALSFRTWNNYAGIPSPPLALFLVMLSKAHLTSHSRMFDYSRVTTPSWLSDPMDCNLPCSLSPWDFLGKKTGVDYHFLLQRTFPTQGSNPCLLNWQVDFSPLLKCCTQYVRKFGKVSNDHRTGKGTFSSQFQRKVMPKNVQTTIQLYSFHMLARKCSKYFKLDFNSVN